MRCGRVQRVGRSTPASGGRTMLCRRVFVISVLGLILASGGTLPAAATTPGSNGRIAFQMDFGRGAEIYTIKPSGLDIQQLTEVKHSAESPDWSPDRTRIVFHIVDRGVWIVNADG